jgi:hypothetical protein
MPRRLLRGSLLWLVQEPVDETRPNFIGRFFVLLRGAEKHPEAGKGPIEAGTAAGYLAPMNPILLILLLVLLFGGGGFYFGGPMIGGGGLGLILVICLIVYLMGGWRTKS